MADKYEIRLPALAIRQGSRWIYTFGVNGKHVETFSTISRARRDNTAELRGYQRPEVVAHIRDIRRYIESENALMPNAVVFAFSSDVRFEPSAAGSDSARPGDLVIPVDEAVKDHERAAWIVDGQQRCAAIRDAQIEDFHIAAVGFIAGDEQEQRAQFILVNSTKPLPKGLIHELLPTTTGRLPARYARKQLPAELLGRLNADADSAFYETIATPTNPSGYIKDNSVLKMIENSLYEGVLYEYRDPASGAGDIDGMLAVLKHFWAHVRDAWPLAWRLPPRKSRLTHGAGIQSLGYIMDLLNDESRAPHLKIDDLNVHMRTLQEVAAWTEGSWQLTPGEVRAWNGLQNTPNDVRQLTNFLVHSLNQG